MERFFTCPYCGAEISMVLDTSVRSQAYVEDCEVCCRPVRIRYSVHGDAIVEFKANRLDE